MGSDGSQARGRSEPHTRRREHQPPSVTTELGWRYHHLGVPTETPRPDERHLARFGMYVAGFETSPFGVEWMRFEATSPVDELIRTVPHLAFEVDDLDAALDGRQVIAEPSSPMDGIRVAMIVHDGAPIELMEIDRDRFEDDACTGEE